MARRALSGSGLIKQYLLCIHLPHQLVAALATHVAVHTLQWKRRPLVVIE